MSIFDVFQKQKSVNVLSIFGGIECGRIAFDRIGIKVGEYYSSEIDEYAIKVAHKNYPDIFHIGSVTEVQYRNGFLKSPNISALTKIDFLIGGSPCQDLSVAKGNGKGLEGEKSGLFYEYVRILKEIKPKYFLLENVASMRKSDMEKITEVLREVYPDTQVHLIDSRLVSAQSRKRLYWTNIQEVEQPKDKNIVLGDIIENIPFDYTEEKENSIWKPIDKKYLSDEVKLRMREKAYPITATYTGACPRDYLTRSQRQFIIGQFRRTSLRIHTEQEKSCTLTSNMGTGGNNVPILIEGEYFWRKLTPVECERLQTLPDGYTDHVSATRRYKAIGNGWTVDVIAHILSFAK